MHKIIFICLFFGSQLHANIICISIPKCGTHLFAKYIKMLTNKESKELNIEDTKKSIKDTNNYFFRTHLRFTPENKEKLNDPSFIKFLLIRDPRDQIISFVFWIIKKLKPEIYEDVVKNTEKYSNKNSDYKVYKNLTFNQLIMHLIYKGSRFYDEGNLFINKNYETHGITEFYKSYLGWIKSKNICITKFEDIIGPKGGGSQTIQIDTLKKAATHAKKNISIEEVEYLSKKLFGKTHTFRKGKAGSWKRYFKPEHIYAFKKVAGQLLVNLGYEKDLNW